MSYKVRPLKNRIAFVSGASRGIGKAIMEKLIAQGYYVIGTYNSSIKESRELLIKHKGLLKFYKVDFAKKRELSSLIEKLKIYKFDLIVNNAGIFEVENFKNYDLNIWNKTFQINLNTVFEICMGLQENINSKGSIINIASTDGNTGSFGGMAYSASKAALINLSKSLANNYGLEGIRVNCISPGWINTAMATQASYEATKLTPLKRNGLPEEIASLVYFLSTSEASFINGANFVIDGGYTNVDYIMKKEAGLL